MKRVVLVLLILVLGSSFAFSFDLLDYPPALRGGNFLIDLGIGYGGWGSSYGRLHVPPIVVTGEYCLPVGVPISVGAMFAFSRYEDSYSWLRDYKWTFTYLTFAGRGNWHWNLPVNGLDLYTGLSLGYQHGIVSYSGPDQDYANYRGSSVSDLYWGFQAGAHYYFTNNIGVMAEVGYPIYIKAGLALKF